MAIAFSCEGCGKSFNVDDRLAGKRSRCKQCGHVFRIPGPSPAPTSQRPARAFDPPPPAFDPYAIDDAPPPSAPPEPEERLPERAGAPAPKKKKKRRSGGNPWLTILLHPRDTVRAILDTDPDRGVMLLFFLHGIDVAIANRFSYEAEVATPLLAIVIGIALLGTIATVASYFIGAAIVQIACQMFGGRGDTPETRVAIAWASAPSVVSLALWIVPLSMFGPDMMRTDVMSVATPSQSLVMGAVFAIDILLGIWCIVLLVGCLAEAHDLPIPRATGAALLSIILGVLAIILLVLLVLGVRHTLGS